MVVRPVVDHRQRAEQITGMLKPEDSLASLGTLDRQFDHTRLQQIYVVGWVSRVKNRTAASVRRHPSGPEDRPTFGLAEHREQTDTL